MDDHRLRRVCAATAKVTKDGVMQELCGSVCDLLDRYEAALKDLATQAATFPKRQASEHRDRNEYMRYYMRDYRAKQKRARAGAT